MAIETIDINSVREYELYVKTLVGKLSISNKHKANLRKIAVTAFNDGIVYASRDLKVEIAK